MSPTSICAQATSSATIPFATSGGSTIKKACADLGAAYPEINWKEGKLLNHISKGDLQKWVESNR